MIGKKTEKRYRIILGVEYSGSTFLGWQTQPHGNTVQDALELGLKKFSREDIHTFCAGRTDAGVHGLEQVIHFDTNLDRTLYSWVNGVNAFLDKRLAVRWAHVLDLQNSDNQAFHARYSARSRTYYYLIFNHAVRSPTYYQKAGWVFRPLMLEKMREGAQFLIGEHDFTAFRAMECQAKSPIKQLYEIDIQRQGDLMCLKFRANAFLHHMVRNIVGSLVYVGVGKRQPIWMHELLLNKVRHVAAPTFMPDGLYLAKIEYDPVWGLPQSEACVPPFLF